jgi:HlyD family secretion protein
LKQRRQRRRWLLAGGVIALLAVVTIGLSRLQPAAPSVEKSTLFMDTVKRGEMLRQVRGNGTLVPEDIRWIPTVNAGRVERILVLPGACVTPDTVLVELSNPEVEQAAFDAESQFKAAKADLANLRVQLASQKLTQQAAVASAQANGTTAESDFEANAALGQKGLAAPLIVKQSKARADELAKLLEIEKERLKICDEAAQAQLAAQEEKIAQFGAQFEMKRRQVEALKMRAGMDGVLQRLGDPASPLQVGQQLAAGALVARVANMTKLKAAIKIPETQARDVQLDQPAEIDTRNGVIAGHVVRIDPAVENGGCGLGRSVAERRAAGSECGWNHPARTVGECVVCGAAGAGPVGQSGGIVQSGGQRQRGDAGARQTGAQFREHDRNHRRFAGR